MKFLTSRDLRQKSGEVWEKIGEEDYIITSNGKPIAILTAASEDLEQQLQILRHTKAEMAVYNLQKQAAQSGLDKLTDQDVEAEIQAARQEALR